MLGMQRRMESCPRAQGKGEFCHQIGAFWGKVHAVTMKQGVVIENPDAGFHQGKATHALSLAVVGQQKSWQ